MEKDNIVQMSFEQAMQRLEEIVSTLERGDAELEKSIELFEEGTRLAAFCSKSLETAEQKITDITKNRDEKGI